MAASLTPSATQSCKSARARSFAANRSCGAVETRVELALKAIDAAMAQAFDFHVH